MHPTLSSARTTLPGPNVVKFPQTPAVPDGQLTWRDRIALHEARDGLASAGYCYVAHKDETPDGWSYDLVQLFRDSEPWSSWCMVRRGGAIRAWRCADGSDLGQFETINEALAAVLAAPEWARARRIGA